MIISSGSKIKIQLPVLPHPHLQPSKHLRFSFNLIFLNLEIHFELQSQWPKFIGTLGIIPARFDHEVRLP